MNRASEQRLQTVHPELATRVRSVIAALAKQGYTIEVVQGLRTFAEQDALFAQGRTKPGQIVTRAKGGQSNHNYGAACDLAPFKDGKPDWNDAKAFALIGSEAKKQGLEWGGDFRTPDRPHVQLPAPPYARLLSLYKGGGLPLVWSALELHLQKRAK